MKPIAPHLTDEHMNFYEWNGGIARFGSAQESHRAGPWRISYGVLAVLTSLLILNGCDRQGPAEAAGEKIDQTVEETRERAADLYDEVTPQPPGPAEQAGEALDDAREAAGEKIEDAGEALKP